MKKILFLLALFSISNLQAQDEESLLDLVEEEEEIIYINNAFKSSRVVNNQSIEMLGAGVLDFRILHRFGKVTQGIDQLFGLDNASMRMAFDYSLTQNMTIGFGRSTYRKELDGFVKYRFLRQSKGSKKMPVSVIAVSGIAVNTLKTPFSNPVEATFARRSAYFHQILIGSKLNEKWTLQLSPTVVHTNYVDNLLQPNDVWAMGFGGRFKLSNRTAIVWDYSYVMNRVLTSASSNPFSIGFDIETGGHVFQLHLSNTNGMNERAFIVDPNGNWTKREIQFGFNLSRVFQLKKS